MKPTSSKGVGTSVRKALFHLSDILGMTLYREAKEPLLVTGEADFVIEALGHQEKVHFEVLASQQLNDGTAALMLRVKGNLVVAACARVSTKDSGAIFCALLNSTKLGSPIGWFRTNEVEDMAAFLGAVKPATVAVFRKADKDQWVAA